jgi:signal transduction histidine kinase
MAADVLARVFDPFFSTKNRGGGLGLPTVSRLLHEGGGSISVLSTPWDGTVFTVFLPLAKNADTLDKHC